MPFVLMNRKSPGVYVQEVPSGSVPIVGVGTSTPAILFDMSSLLALNVTVKLEDKDLEIAYADGGGFATNAPILVTNFTEFKERAGEAYRRRLQAALARAKNAGTVNEAIAKLTEAIAKLTEVQKEEMAEVFASMYGFFLNGGTRCYVVAYDKETLSAALETLKPLDDVSLVLAPGLPGLPDLASQIKDHCTAMGDRMAILSLKDLKDTAGSPSGHVACYCPWIKATNPLGKEPVLVDPSAHIAGLWGRVDATRGVHKAPANVDLLGAVGVEVELSRGDQDGLNYRGINAIRPIQGAIRVYGARTLGGDSQGEFKFINVQRTLIYLARSIEQGMQWVVFEPNTPALWGKVCRNINAFLHSMWAAGALFGNTAEEAWYVRCDEALNPPDVRDTGNLKVEVGVAISRPAEFIVINLSQWTGPGK